MRNLPRLLRLAGLLAATATLAACDVSERLTGTKPHAACMTRSYDDTISISYDTIRGPLHFRLGGCKP